MTIEWKPAEEDYWKLEQLCKRGILSGYIVKTDSFGSGKVLECRDEDIIIMVEDKSTVLFNCCDRITYYIDEYFLSHYGLSDGIGEFSDYISNNALSEHLDMEEEELSKVFNFVDEIRESVKKDRRSK